MASIPFRYPWTYRFFRKFGDETKDVFAHMFEADYDQIAMKRERVVKFKMQSMHARRVPDDDPVLGRRQAELGGPLLGDHGTYLIFCKDTIGRLLYIVQPWLHDSSFLTAHHFSFHVDNDAIPEERLRLYRTTYSPNVDIPNGGYTHHIDNFLPLNFEIPDDVTAFSDTFMKDAAFKNNATLLHALMTRPPVEGVRLPWTAVDSHRTPEACPPDFNEMWERLPIHRILAIGVRNGDGFDVTVFVFLRFKDGVMHSMTLRTDRDRDLRADIARHFKNYRWDHFRMPPPDDYEDEYEYNYKGPGPIGTTRPAGIGIQ